MSSETIQYSRAAQKGQEYSLVSTLIRVFWLKPTRNPPDHALKRHGLQRDSSVTFLAILRSYYEIIGSGEREHATTRRIYTRV